MYGEATVLAVKALIQPYRQESPTFAGTKGPKMQLVRASSHAAIGVATGVFYLGYSTITFTLRLSWGLYENRRVWPKPSAVSRVRAMPKLSTR